MVVVDVEKVKVYVKPTVIVSEAEATSGIPAVAVVEDEILKEVYDSKENVEVDSVVFENENVSVKVVEESKLS